MRLGVPLLLLALVPREPAVADEAAEPKAPRAPRLIAPRTGAAKSETAKAVEAGLDWLARHRGADGLWDADGFAARCAAGGPACEGKGKGQHGEDVPCPFDGAISALAVLAFLGAGHVPGGESAHARLVETALERLGAGGDTWAVPVVTEALAEVEVLEGKGRWRATLDANVARLVAARQPDGAWGYAAPWRGGSDVPYTALVVPALLAARDAGCKVPDDLATGVDRWLGTLEEDEGRLAYLRDGRSYGYTPTTSNAHAGFALRELLETTSGSRRHADHAALVASEAPSWKISFREVDVPGRGRVRVQVGHLSMLAWWYGTMGSFQRGGAAWSRWWGALKGALLPHQVKTGCARGSWNPEGTYERQTGGRVFATALGVLMLEEPVRHRRLAPP